MSKIVRVVNNEVFTDSFIIAEGTGNQHHTITRLMRKYESEFCSFGKLGFKIQPSLAGQQVKIYELNEPQATFLMTLLRNSDQVVQFKLKLTKEFFKLRQALVEQSAKTVPQIDTSITNNNQFLYTIDEAAEILKVNKNQVYKLINANVLKYIKIGRKKIPRWCIDEFLRDNVGLDVTNPFNIVKLEYTKE